MLSIWCFPVDVITAGSRAKDVAVVDILRRELAALGPRLRAVVVTDAAERSAVHRALDVLAAPGRPGAAGGARRCYDVLLSDADLRALSPVLLTGREVRVPHGRDELLERLRERTRADLPARDDGWSLRASAGEARAELVLAVSRLVAEGRVRLIIGTQELLGLAVLVADGAHRELRRPRVGRDVAGRTGPIRVARALPICRPTTMAGTA